MTLFATRHRGLATDLARLERSLGSDATVLLLGAPGTGKDRLARLLHERSPRASEPFVRIDLASLSDDLFESELFGHERGAFTGAEQARRAVQPGRGGAEGQDPRPQGDIGTYIQSARLRTSCAPRMRSATGACARVPADQSARLPITGRPLSGGACPPTLRRAERRVAGPGARSAQRSAFRPTRRATTPPIPLRSSRPSAASASCPSPRIRSEAPPPYPAAVSKNFCKPGSALRTFWMDWSAEAQPSHRPE